ncbi:Aldo/keto reductase [Polychaeton citri CBS 116435]|uniref:Aldo/keto reductase n=1 Tax=Polychaeton citri CBS 116435 TaxID=1314669 RepID=A0A9P4UM73_9PEZI|nr:Aldo/keto reductase [Polychaeton citri CBS 116435]
MANQQLAIDTKVKMNSGYEIPLLGYGEYQTPANVAESVCLHALNTGYRHIDSALVYRNEEPSASALLKFIKEKSVPRDQLFFTSKVPPKSVNYRDAKVSIEQSLKNTGLDYFDLYLLHAPYGGRKGRLGAWEALVEAVAEGKIRSIGVSNYGVHHLEELEKWQEEQPEHRRGIISVNQVELHPWLARPDIVEWCKTRGIVMEAYSPLVRAQRNEEPLLKKLGEKHKKTPAQILLRWGLQMGFVILPKSVTPSRIEENVGLYDFELDEEDLKALDTKEYAPCAWDPTTEKLEK